MEKTKEIKKTEIKELKGIVTLKKIETAKLDRFTPRDCFMLMCCAQKWKR